MSRETDKNFKRRTSNGDFDRFFNGVGIDIGCGKCPVLPTALKFDKMYGNDANNLSEFSDGFFDYVHSSHCLEHLEWPTKALQEWWRVVKPGGYLIVTVPEFTLYEKRNIPSIFNSDHKHQFTMEYLLNLLYKFRVFKDFQLLRLQINDEGFDYTDKKSDQTLGNAQAEIEMIVHKPLDPFWCDL